MEIVSRQQWGVLKEQSRPKMPLPAREVWLHHSVTSVTRDPHTDQRAIQRIGIQRFGYYSYSYAFHPSGVIMEGQGLRVGAHTAKRNSSSFGLVLIGDYTNRDVTPEQEESVRWAIDWLQDNGHLRRGVYPTGGHRDLMRTACPGNRAYPLIPRLRLPWESPAAPEVSVVVANSPFVAVLVHPSGGYLQVGADGGIFAWNDNDEPDDTVSFFFGSTGGMQLNAPVVAACWSPTQMGYWLAAADGGVFNFGDAGFHGGMGGQRLNKPIVSIGGVPEGGYILAAQDGGIFPFGPGTEHLGNALWRG